MIIIAKRASAIALAMGVAALTAGCGGHGPNSYLMPKDAVKAKLTEAEKHYTLALGGRTDVRATAWRGDRLQVSIVGSSGNADRCEAVVEAIDEEWTRVTPDCGDASTTSEQIENELNRMKVDEFVIAVLYNDPMNSDAIANRTSAIVIDNVGDIQREAAASMNEAAAAAADLERSKGSEWGADSTGW